MAVRCLIVEDNDCFRRVAQAVLNSQGIDVVGVASTGAEAVQRAGELDPDVALVDVCLGDECGFEVARQLRGTATAERPQVILISAYPEADFGDMIAASPCLGFLPKASLSGEAIRALLQHSRRRGVAVEQSNTRVGNPMEADDRSLIRVLTRDHRRVANMLLRLPMTHGTHRRRLADELTSELIRHAVAEDLYLYPAVPAFVPAWAVDAAGETGAHTRIEQLLTDLTHTAPDNLSFDALVTKLVAEVDRETRHQELDVFPQLARYCDPPTLIQLGEKIQAFKHTAVVEKTPDAGLTIRRGARVLHRWGPPPAPGVRRDIPPVRRTNRHFDWQRVGVQREIPTASYGNEKDHRVLPWLATAKSRHQHLASLGHYSLGEQTSARVTAEHDPAARRRAR